MANNYLQFSFVMPLKTVEHVAFVTDLLVQLADCSDKYIDPEGQFADIEFDPWVHDLVQQAEGFTDVSLQTVAAYEVWFAAEECGDVEITAAFVQRILKEFPELAPVGFTYAYTCSKMRADEFGGGGVVVTKDVIHTWEASTWVNYKLREVTT